MRKGIGAGLAVLALLLAGATRARGEYIVTSLPGIAAALNDSGQVAGSFQFPFMVDTKDVLYRSQAYLYTNGVTTALAPGGSFETGSSQAYSINNLGLE